jgi:hypothetical protein
MGCRPADMNKDLAASFGVNLMFKCAAQGDPQRICAEIELEYTALKR